MRPSTLSAPEHSRAVLQQEINRHQDASYDHRLHCVLLVASGLSCEQTAKLFRDSPRTLVNWVRRFDRQGLAGLAEGNHSGRPARISAEQLEEVRGWPWISCRPIARNSTRLSGCGSGPGETASTTCIFRSWRRW